MKVKVVVVGTDCGGVPDYIPYIINLSKEDFKDGQHYTIAITDAELNDFEHCLACDEFDPLFKPFKNSINWKKSNHIQI